MQNVDSKGHGGSPRQVGHFRQEAALEWVGAGGAHGALVRLELHGVVKPSQHLLE